MSDSPLVDRYVVPSAARRGTPRPFDVELADFLADIIQKVIGHDGRLSSDMLIAVREGVMRFLINMPSTASDRQAVLAELGARLGREQRRIGPLVYVFAALEAWMVYRDAARPGVLPHDHPNRIDILSIVTWQAVTSAYRVRIYRLLRGDDGLVRDLVVEQDWDEARAYLVEAFVNAYPPTIA